MFVSKNSYDAKILISVNSDKGNTEKLFSTKHYGRKEFHICNMLLFLHDVIKYNRPMMTLLKNSKFHSTYKSLD